MAKLVFHVDVNRAYPSWEATREPDIRLIPAVIGIGDNKLLAKMPVILKSSIQSKGTPKFT